MVSFKWLMPNAFPKTTKQYFNLASNSMEPFIGQIMQFAGDFAPRGWALCNGQLLAINDNQALFSIVGTIYGGDGRTTFGLPDLRGRAAMHEGSGPGLSTARLGSKGGRETVTINVTQLPSHTHTHTYDPLINCDGENASTTSPSGTLLATGEETYSPSTATPTATMHDDSITGDLTIDNAGGNQPTDVRQPYTVVNFIIALQGVYPSRS